MTDREVGARARHRQRDQVRRDDGHDRDPLGGCAGAGRSGRSRRRRSTRPMRCRELARRYLHVFGPTTAASFARWAGISRRAAADTFASLEGALLPVRSPLGDEWLLAEDEPVMRAAATAAAPARLLPSGDAYFLLDGAERELLVPRRNCGSGSGRPASGRARSSSTARSAEPGGGRSTPCGSSLGTPLARGGATRSRPRRPPCRFRASTGRSRWSGRPSRRRRGPSRRRSRSPGR